MQTIKQLRFFKARTVLYTPCIDDIEDRIHDELDKLPLPASPGASIAITAGSRGISQITRILRAIVRELTARGYRPFLVNAMGSHGGASVEGQLAILRKYGIVEDAIGTDIKASMDVVDIGKTPDGHSVYFDKISYQADAVLLVNRVKPHTTLTGNLGSGLRKMAAIGLGNQIGADHLHKLGIQQHLPAFARAIVENTPIVGGIAIIENHEGKTAHIEAVAKPDILARDTELLAQSRQLLPKIPFSPIDVLVIKQMGKNISGTGIDPNIIGMHRRHGGAPDIAINTIVVLDLTEHSRGNATGIGMADIITDRLKNKIDWTATSTNCLTGSFVAGMKLPYALPSDTQAIDTALQLSSNRDQHICIIQDTLHPNEIYVSESLYQEARKRNDLEIVLPPAPLRFDSAGNLDCEFQI